MRDMKKRSGKFKRLIAWFLTLALLLPASVMGSPEETAAAAGAKVSIRTNYVNFSRNGNKIVTIDDIDMMPMTNKQVYIEVPGGGFQSVTTSTIGGTTVQGTVNNGVNIMSARVAGDYVENGVNVARELRYPDINENAMPEIVSISTPMVGVDANNNKIVIHGSNTISNLLNPGYTVMVGNVTANVTGTPGANQVTLDPGTSQFPLGSQDITIIYRQNITTAAKVDAMKPVETFTYSLENFGVYQNAVTVVGTIDLNGIQMFPSLGEVGSQVRFTRDSLSDYDVYFIKNLDMSEFDAAHRATDFNLYQSADAGEDDVITVNVPKGLSPGEYYVVFTNFNSAKDGVRARYILTTKFTIVQLSQTPVIVNVNPNRAPSQTETIVTINGYFLAIHNVPGFTPDSPNTATLNYSDSSQKEIVINYGSGTLDIGGDKYRVSVSRRMQVFVGGLLSFYEEAASTQVDKGFKPQFAQAGQVEDVIQVKTATQQLDSQAIVDVIVDMTTTIATTTDTVPNKVFTGAMYKQVMLTNGFTYEASTERPSVTDIIPTPIPVEWGGSSYYLAPAMNELLISIEGGNFLVTRYMEGVTEVIRYPQVTLGNTLIDLNNSPSWLKSFQVLNGNTEVTGMNNNEIGNRILIKLETGASGFPVDSKDSRTIIIRNPLRRGSGYSVPYPFEMQKDIFKLINENEFPNITGVNPNLVDIAGGTPVVITGTNLRTGSKVYIDGKPVSNITINGSNTQITFNAPAGRVGTTQLIVINPNDGGIATWPFSYTQTYTQPTLTGISPPEGTTNTLVTLKGSNFAASDPSILVNNLADIDELLMYRLIGTRVELGGYDVNNYYRVGGRIALQTYINGVDGRAVKNPPFVLDANGTVQIDPNYEGVVFRDETNKKFYVIRRDVRGNFTLEDGYGIKYSVTYSGGKFYASTGGTTYEIDQSTKGRLKFNGLTLDGYTPYTTERVGGYDEITGLRAFYRDSNTLNIKIPAMVNSPWTSDGYYDVAVINPDTRKTTITKGFRYYSLGRIIPEVVDIIPAQGTSAGGNIIVLYGPAGSDSRIGFSDLGTSKTRVFIGNVEVPAADVQIAAGGRRMDLRVPASKEDFAALGTDRVTLPIVLVNPDGGSFDVSINRPIIFTDPNRPTIYGYTYVVPSSHPQIASVVLNSGTAAGEAIVDITGSDFRDFSPFTDLNGNGVWEAGEPFTDLIGCGYYHDYAVDANGNVIEEYDHQDGSAPHSLRPLLPDVYFGNQKAEILSFVAPGYIQVKTPAGTGAVNVTVVNQDGGVSNAVRYTYVTTSPVISGVLPNVVNKRGHDLVDVTGSNFIARSINMMRKDTDPNTGLSLIDTISPMPLVKVGNRTNKNLKKEDDNSGWIKANIATVNLDGGLQVWYNAATYALTVTINANEQNYTSDYVWDGSQTVFINTLDLRAGSEGFHDDVSLRIEPELIRFQLTSENRLIVDAGYASEATLTNGNIINFRAPYYYTVGQTPLYVVNPDGGEGASSIEYRNPASNPVITNITRDNANPVSYVVDGREVLILRMNYRGGSLINVIGQDFQENAVIQIGDFLTVQPGSITYTIPDRLAFQMPAVDIRYVGTDLYKVLVTNPDGATANSAVPPTGRKEIYIQFTRGETEPAIEGISTLQGPAEGGTWIHIKGKDFRSELAGYDGVLKVYVGGIEALGVQVVDTSNLLVQTPPGQSGAVEVSVENPDGERTGGSRYTYISDPKLTGVFQNLADIPVTNVSVTGGEVVRIKGSGFMPGARVVVAPTVEPSASGTGGGILYRAAMKVITLLGVTLNSNELDTYALTEGIEGTVEFIDNSTLRVTMPAATLSSSGIMVINPDGGISNVFTGVGFDLPSVDPPDKVVAEIVRDEVNDRDLYIRVTWSAVSGAKAYEIFVVEGGNQFLVGTTDQTTFIYTRLKPRTEYSFIVKAIGDYLFSEPSLESNTVRTGRNVGAEVTDPDLGAKTSQIKVGSAAQITIGTEDAKHPLVIDLTRGTLTGSTEAAIILPARVIYGSAVGNIEVRGASFNLQFHPSAFRVQQLEMNRDDTTAGVKLQLTPNLPPGGVSPVGSVASVYTLEAVAYRGTQAQQIEYTTQNVSLAVMYDQARAQLRHVTNPCLYRFDTYTGQWVSEYNWNLAYNGQSVAVNRMGQYTVMNKR